LEEFAREHIESLAEERRRLAPGQRYVRGLYSGGTLADEAAYLLAEHLERVRAGAGFGRVLPLEDWEDGQGHCVIDLGEDRFTKSRPHPMIDPGLRNDRIEKESRDPTVVVILLDLVLGQNVRDDPAGDLAPVIAGMRRNASREGRHLAVVVHVCGTQEDPQDLEAQVQQLQAVGCLVFQSNIEAALAAAWIAGGAETL
jgi:FdrA protein